LFATVPEGEDVIAFVGGLGVPEGTWVSGVGTLTDVVVSVPADGGNGNGERMLPGRTQLLSLAGPVGGPLMVTLLAVESGLTALSGGQLVRGRSAAVSLFLSESRETPSVPGAKPETSAGKTPSVDPGDDDESDEAPRYGDRVDHFVFGLCDVMVVREERMKIRAAAGGKLREIHLRAVKVLKPTLEDGRRVFKLARLNK
jgi:hypothetical protein